MLIGLTGSISTGKSTVSKIFIKYGIPVIDSDKIAREIVEPQKKAWKQIVEYFGQDILHTDTSINRKKLGEIIFDSIEKKKVLEEITHPIIFAEIHQIVKMLEKEHSIIVVDVPLLYEANVQNMFDKIIVVYVEKEEQLLRLIKRDKISKENANLRINAQLDINNKKEKADILINNNLSEKETEKQVKEIIDFLHKELDKLS